MPPANLDAERGVLGSVLVWPAALDEIGGRLSAADFYEDRHGRLWTCLTSMRDAGRPLDAVSVRAELQRRGDWEAIGGPAYFGEIMQAVPYGANAVYFANLVREKAAYRSVIRTAEEMLRDAYDETAVDPKDLIDRAERMLSEVRTGEHADPVVPAMEAAARALSRIDEAVESKTGRGVLTGIVSLDEAIGGLTRGELAILAARPSVGKTALACQIACHVASRGGRVYLASLEMDATELALRIVAGDASVNATAIKTASLTPDDTKALGSAAGRLAALPLWIDERPSMTVMDIRRSARRLARKEPLALIVVDYLQIVTLPDRGRNAKRYELIGAATKELKGLARELKCPLLCLAQVGRDQEKEKGPPKLHHLRESGDIEANADAVYFLWPPDTAFLRGERYADERKEVDRLADEGTPMVWLSAAKQRNGPKGTYRLLWLPTRTRFEQHEWGASAGGYAKHDEFNRFGRPEEF